MGFSGLLTTNRMMKSILFAALVAAAYADAEPKADADADAYYGYYGLGYRGYGYRAYPYGGYRGYYGYRLGKRSADAEPTADADAYYGYYGHGYGLGYRSYAYPAYRSYAYGAYPYAYGAYHAIGKRSADAEPAADADAYYGYYGYAAP